jgi:phage tail-like protein
MRGMVEGLGTPAPVLHRLPGVLQDDDLTRRFVAAFDDGFAPVLATLDGLASYVDPALAPPDFLDWLAGWVGVELDDAWTTEQRRSIIAGAALVHRLRGTARGITEALGLALGAGVELRESGGCAWSATPGGEPPGTDPPSLVVTITVDDPTRVDTRRVEDVLASVKPAHVACSYRIVAPDQPAGAQ